jgi:hypothetical protein
MRKIVNSAIILAIVLISSGAFALDQNYVKTFGWGKVLITDKGMPPFGRMDAAQFSYSAGQFQITGGENRQMGARILLKDGKTYGYYLDKVKKANPKKVSTMKNSFLRTYIYVSHDVDGTMLSGAWPAAMDQKPKLAAFTTIESNLEKTWDSSVIDPQAFNVDGFSFMNWLKSARPGWTAYFVHVAGFTRDAPELKYWDRPLLKWMIPIEYVESEPIAVGQAIIAGSTNPALAWSHKVVQMPAAMDGQARGEMSVLKDGAPYTVFTFNIKLSYQNQVTKMYNYVIQVFKKDGKLSGGYPVSCPALEACVANAFHDAVNRELAMGALVKDEPAAVKNLAAEEPAAVKAPSAGETSAVSPPKPQPASPSKPSLPSIPIPKFW